MPLVRIITLLLSLAFALGLLPRLQATTVAPHRLTLQAVEFSTPNSSPQYLNHLLFNEVFTSPDGWQVPAPTDTPHSAIFRCTEPFSANRTRIHLWFKTTPPNSCFRDFSLSATTDPNPSLAGKWAPVYPVLFNADRGALSRTGTSLHFSGAPQSSRFIIDASLPFDKVTGFRLDVSAIGKEGQADAQAVLTEMKIEWRNTSSTNIALGSPVKASQPLPGGMEPEFLTDGSLATLASPPPPSPDQAQPSFLEIDLKRPATLDHLRFHFRRDPTATKRLPSLSVELYQEPPTPGSKPLWKSHYQATGTTFTHSQAEFTEIIRPQDNEAPPTGRYLRIVSDPQSPSLPLIAELEAYEVLLPVGVNATIGNKTYQTQGPLQLPCTTGWLTFNIQYPQEENPSGLGRRWRIARFHDDWLAGTAKGSVESRCPPPGEYELQAQIRHSDGTWNNYIFRKPLIILVPFWQRPIAQAGFVLVALILTALIAWKASRHRMAKRLAELERHKELSNERTRIANDMHDAVGTQLTQLTKLQEKLANKLPLTDEQGDQFQQLIDISRSSSAALDEVIWIANPETSSLANTASYMAQTAHQYLTPLGIICLFDIQQSWPDLTITSQRRHHLFLAFKKVLQNIIKYAQASEVTITLKHKDHWFIITIADNGVGMPMEAPTKQQSGLRTIHTRLAEAGGTCQVNSFAGHGTTVELRLRLPS